MESMNGSWPGEVASYDGDSRTCRVRIPGITDGSSVLPIAVFSNPLGDRSSDTEIRILPNDPVWLQFECGDPRFPIITGYRTPRVGNPVEWRRWRHANVEITADLDLVLNATTLKVFVSADATVTVGGNAHVQVNGSTTVSSDGPATISAPTINLNGR